MQDAFKFYFYDKILISKNKVLYSPSKTGRKNNVFNQKQLKKIMDIGGILLYVLPATYLFLSATLFQFSILTDLSKAVQSQIPNQVYQQESTAIIPNTLLTDSRQKEESPLIPVSKSIYLYFLVMTSLILAVIVLSLFGQILRYQLVSFYQFFSPPQLRLCVPQFRAPPF